MERQYLKVTEFSSSTSSAEYYKSHHHHKSNENLDSMVGRNRSPYGGYVNFSRDYATDVTPSGWKTDNKFSKSSEQLSQDAATVMHSQHQQHYHQHQEFSSTNIGGTGGVAVVPNEYYPNGNRSAINNIQVLPSSNLANERYQYENMTDELAGYNGRYQSDLTGGRNIIVDVISQPESDIDTNETPIGGEQRRNGPGVYVYNNKNYSGIPDAIVSSATSSSSSNDLSQSNNLRTIISEAIAFDKSQRPTNFFPSTTSYERSNSSQVFSNNSNLKNIYAEASMTSAIRSPTTPQAHDFYPPPPPPPSQSQPSTPINTGGANLKNIYQEALTDQYHRSNSNTTLDSTSKNANLKRIFAEASEAAANPSRVSLMDDRTSNMKRIVNEAAIVNSLADKITAINTPGGGLVGPNQHQMVYPPPTVSTYEDRNLTGERHEFSSAQSASTTEIKRQVISTSEQTTTTQQQHHFHATSSSSTSVSGSGSNTLIGRPAINNQITMPIEEVYSTAADRKSHLVGIMSDVMATNSSAYDPSHANRFAFTGPNANLKSIVAEAADYNARIAPTTSQNMYYNPHEPSEMNQNNIIGENKGFGMTRLTVHYDQLRSRLSVTVHEARYLKNLDKKSVSDPYARVYLVPDGKPSYKRKTKIVKNNLNPVWQETFDYPMTLNDALSKVLTVNLKDERGFFEKQEGQFLGEVVIALSSIKNLTEPFTKWFFLQPLKSTSNVLASPSNVSYF